MYWTAIDSLVWQEKFRLIVASAKEVRQRKTERKGKVYELQRQGLHGEREQERDGGW